MESIREMLDLQIVEMTAAFCKAHPTAMVCLLERFQNNLQDIGDGTAQPPDMDTAPPELSPQSDRKPKRNT